MEQNGEDQGYYAYIKTWESDSNIVIDGKNGFFNDVANIDIIK